MKAISLRQPWAWLVIHAGKDIENRTWNVHYRGDLLIHASKTMTREDWREAVAVAKKIDPKISIPTGTALKFGGIIGKVTMVGTVVKHESPWFFGPYGFVLEDPKPIEFFEYSGTQGFFEVSYEMQEEVKSHTRRQLMSYTAKRMVGHKVTFRREPDNPDSRATGWVVKAKVGKICPVSRLLGYEVLIRGKSGKEVTIDSNESFLNILWDRPKAW